MQKSLKSVCCEKNTNHLGNTENYCYVLIYSKKKLLENKNQETLLCCHWIDPFSVKLFLVLLFNKGTNLTHYLVKPSSSFSPVVINLNFLIDSLQFLRLQKPFRNHLGNYFRETLSARFILNQKP